MFSQFMLTFGIGHILGDFYFQGSKLAKEKNERFSGVLKHSLEYAITMLVVTVFVFSPELMIAALILSLSHFLIDHVKFLLIIHGHIKPRTASFVLDQCAHLFFIIVCALVMNKLEFSVTAIAPVSDLASALGVSFAAFAQCLLALLMTYMPANIFIQIVLRDLCADSFVSEFRVGKWVGTVERIILLVFIALNINAGIGVGIILCAKAAYRRNRINGEKGYAKYFLVGSALSMLYTTVFGIIILSGFSI